MRVVLATGNLGKLREFADLLGPAGLEFEPLSAFGIDSPEETGASFVENALLKARHAASLTGLPAMADDSGLEVDALGGAPGVRSARFAGETATDAENNVALLAALEGHDSERGAGGYPARFRCVLALHDPYSADAPSIVEGVCEGGIVGSPRGGGGFGYDPLFLVAGRDRTMAELDDEKNQISHRARAFAKVKPLIEKRVHARDEAIRRIVR